MPTYAKENLKILECFEKKNRKKLNVHKYVKSQQTVKKIT